MEELMNKINEEINVRKKVDSKEQPEEATKDKEIFQLSIKYDELNLDKKILGPFRHLMSVAGKNIRKDIVIGCNYWLKAPDDIVDTVLEIIYLVHNTSLIIDDMQDGSDLRRGVPCAHHIYGIPNTLNMIRFLLAINSSIILKLNNHELTHVFAECAIEMVRGQAMDVYWRDNSICPTEEEYKLMILRKTGSFFCLVSNILQFYATEERDTSTISEVLSMYFQISDDYLNLSCDLYHSNKGFCEDISEGKFSFPVVYVVNNFPEDGKILMDILRQQTKDIELIKHALSIIEKCGGLEYTRKVIEEYKELLAEECKKLGYNAYFDEKVIGRIANLQYNPV